jgi:hypothetical protein
MADGMGDYISLVFGLVFIAVGLWYTLYPARAKVFLVRRGASSRTVFGSDPTWIIRCIGLIFMLMALFMIMEAIRGLAGMSHLSWIVGNRVGIVAKNLVTLRAVRGGR